MPAADESNAPALRRARSFSPLPPAALSAAALLGFLIGLGHRAGVSWRVVNAAAHVVLGARADDVWGFTPDVTVTGGAVVLASSAAAGMLAARLGAILPVRVAGVLSPAIVAGLAYLVHARVAARTSSGVASLLSTGELRAVYVVLAVSLAAGMRLAFSASARTTRARW